MRSTQAKHSRQPQQPADLPSHTDLSGPEPSPSLGEDCNQSFLERSGSPQRRPGMHEQSAEGPSEYSRAAAGHSKTHQTAMGKHRGWPGICPGAVLNGHHKVQTWLGVRTFLSLVPASYSRRILNDQVICPSDIRTTSPSEKGHELQSNRITMHAHDQICHMLKD